MFPASDEPGRADAVVVFAGAGGERQAAGLRLVRDGVAPVLVVSDGGQAGSPGARMCRRRPAGLRLHCLTPSPATTRGEARAFADLAERESWGSLVLVTSAYHVRRASLLLDRCYRGRLRRVSVPHGGAQQVAAEWLSLTAAVTLFRPC